MKSVQCPLCYNKVFSESFLEGEKFPCPHCEHTLEVETYEDEPRVKSPELGEHMNWAKSIWKDGRLFLTSQKLSILGELFVQSLGMAKWSGQPEAELRQRLADLEKAQKLLAKEGIPFDLIGTARTFLDLFLNLKKEEPNP